MGKLYILNAPILTAEGSYRLKKISVNEARKLLNKYDFISAIGHQSTAEIISEILGIEIPFNRISIQMNRGDIAIVFKLKARPPEGKILTKEEIEEIGFDLYLLKRTR